MGISEIYIVKRDGKRAPFSVEKIKRAISKAFLSVGGYATDDDLTSVLSRVRVSDGMSVEEIQNQVEVALMAERYFAVAKSYMLYRQKHSEDREDREKLEFLINYCDAKNPATGSKYDANANVENKNIATLIGELPKRNFIRLNRRLLTDRIKEMYGKELSDKYLRLLNGHFIYKNDETSMPTTAPRSRCTRGCWAARCRWAATRRARPTSSRSAAGSSTWSSSSRRCSREPARRPNS